MTGIEREWTTITGERIKIESMGDTHLVNTIKMLLRRAYRMQVNYLLTFPSFNGEMAQVLAEQEWDHLNEMPVEEFASVEIPIYNDLVKEAKRRGLTL